ncbi:MAG: NnrU family protein [Thiotrichales bacterium]
MTILLIGVLLWSAVHLFPVLAPAARARWIARLGTKYQGLFALVIGLALLLIVFGWRGAPAQTVYLPPEWGAYLSSPLMLLAILLFGASHGQSRIQRWLRHPMLSSVVVWATAHLLVNGDSRSIVLFGGLALWALVSQPLINRRDGAWVRPAVAPPWSNEVKLLVIALIVYAVLLFAHPYLAGVPLIAI